jgi:membrane associated rhomboid family serine protease
VSAPELSVVCKSCGSEVSPYVTECPYCGARLRKRAPKLQRRGESLEARTKQRRRRLRFGRSRAEAREGMRPYATIGVIAASVALLLVGRATGDSLYELGGIAGPVGSQWWRYLTAPFAYIDTGYLFVVAAGLALFGPGLERRLGTVPTLLLFLGCGALGMLAADAIDPTSGLQLLGPSVPTTEFRPFGAPGDVPVSGGLAGGNGMALGALAAWVAIRFAETRRTIDAEFDTIGAGVAAAVLILLPLFDDEANVYAAFTGMLVGLLAGIVAAALQPSE